jgi:hypothetical protein
MSTAEIDRRGLWRRLLHRALAQGDLLGASRAFDHLRGAGAALTREEADAAREARIAVGHAIRDARWRHGHDVLYGIPVGGVAAPALARHRVWASPRVLGAVVAAAAMIAFVLLWRPGIQGLPAPALVPVAPAVPTALAFNGRGRTEATARPIALPSAAPTLAPRPTFPVVGPGGAGTGTDTQGTGFVLPALPNDWDRFLFRVVDENGKPLANVCVIYGTSDCGPTRPHTNSSGLWWIDFPRSDSLSRTWDFGFAMSGFEGQRVLVEYKPGATNVKEIRLIGLGDGR